MSAQDIILGRLEELMNREFYEGELMKCSFNLNKQLVNEVDFLASRLQTSRQDIVNDILTQSIKEAFDTYAKFLQLNTSQFAELKSKVDSGVPFDIDSILSKNEIKKESKDKKGDSK